MKQLIVTLMLTAISFTLLAQEPCGAVRYSRALLQQKGLSGERERFENQLRSEIQQRQLQQTLDLTTVYTIPVVFHCVYKQESDSLTVPEFRMALARLNEDFNNRHSDFGSIPTRFINDTGRMNVQFVIAAQDPNGNPTNGILYHKTAREYNESLPYEDDFMKRSSSDGSDAWNTQQFLNIWVCRLNGGVNGFATFPENLASDPNSDGVVVHTDAFGIRIWNNPTTNYNRTLTHEVGHWLSLRHVWGDDQNSGNTCGVDDGVTDTPLQGVPNFGIYPPSYIHTSCSNGSKGDMWMNFMDYVDHLSRLMFSQGQVTRARTILETTRSQLIQSKRHLPPVHNRTNQSVWLTNAFTGLAVGKNHTLWAGSNREGLYKHNGTSWEVSNGALDGYRINHMLADKQGGIWIAQQGSLAGGAYASGGGVHYYPDGSSFTGRRYFSDNTTGGLPTKSGRSIWVDTFYSGAQQPRVWVATMNQLIPPDDNPVRGGIALGLNSTTPYFNSITEGLNTSIQNTGCYTIGGDSTEVYVYAPNNGGNNQILVYQASNGAYKSAFDNGNTGGVLSATMFPRAIYSDKFRNKWIGMESGGIAVRQSNGNWVSVNFAEFFPSGTMINNNAITGDELGQVFIGTTNGLVVFNGTDPTLASNYKRFTVSDSLPSNNVTALTIDPVISKLVIGTDAGITWRDKDCLAKSCIPEVPKVAYSLRNGSWNDAGTWSTGSVPDCKTIVVLYHTITVNTPDATCAGFFLVKGSNATVSNKITMTGGLNCQ